MKNLVFCFCLLLLGSIELKAQNLSDSSSNEIPPPPPEVTRPSDERMVFTVVEDMPEFPGGQDSMMKFISHHVNYPKKAKEKGTKGRVVVQFVVNEEGKLENIKIVKGIGDGCDEEVIRVMKLMPNWKPGKQRGKPVKVRYNLPVRFNLDD